MPPPPYNRKVFRHLNQSRCGFTLAETLITLAIIGIVAALTVPTLLNKYQQHAFRAAARKKYAEISTVHSKMLQDDQLFFNEVSKEVTDNEYADNPRIFDRYYKTSGDYIATQPNGVTQNIPLCQFYRRQGKGALKNLDGYTGSHVAWNSDNHAIAFKLQDGSIIQYSNSIAYAACPWAGRHYLNKLIIVDVNGEKGPNTVGVDVFAFHPVDNSFKSIVPAGTDPLTKGASPCCKNKGGWACSAEMIKDTGFKIPNKC